MSTSPRYPLGTRILVVVAVALGVTAFVLAGLTADTDNGDSVSVSGDPGQAVNLVGVEALLPGDGDQVERQRKFGIDLTDGWAGELSLRPPDGPAIAIPADQTETTALNVVQFTPGPGQVVETLTQGENCVVATIWSLIQGRDATERVEQWCFTVF